MVARSGQPQFPRCHITDRIAVHGQLSSARRRDDMIALGLHIGQYLRADRLDLRHDQVWLMFFDRCAQPVAVEHRKDLAGIGDLHRGRMVIGVAGDHIGAQTLGRDGEFAAQFAGAEEQDFSGEGHGSSHSPCQTARHLELNDQQLRCSRGIECLNRPSSRHAARP